MTSAVVQGRQKEWKVRDALIADGYEVLRAAGSKGALDLLAIKPGEQLFVQVKSGQQGLGPAAWNRLFDLAAMVGAIPILADVQPRVPVAYWRLVARKERLGKQPYERFYLDRVGI